jgi:anti-sigma B factor antagonist
MKIDMERPRPGHLVMRPKGRMDADTAPILKQAIKQVASDESGLIVVIDLGEVDFIDSSGLSALVSGLKALRQAKGALRLCRPHPQGMTALRLTMLDRVFPIFPSTEAALGSLHDPGIA